MSTSREGPNPLRPYYIPPSIGIPPEVPLSTNSTTHGVGLKNGSAASYASSARDIFSDIDYSDYLADTSPSTIESLQKLINDTFTNYAGILCAQPFEVAKTVLQVKLQDPVDGSSPAGAVENIRKRPSNNRGSLYDDNPSDDSDADETSYFTSAAPQAKSPSRSRSRRRYSSEGSDYKTTPPPKAPPKPAHQLVLKRSDSIMEVIGQEWSKEGAWGVWKATNVTFIYGITHKTLESWLRSMISAVLNIPDPGLATADVVGSPNPWTSLGVTVAAAATAGLILAPMDLVRTKLILTPTSSAKRSLAHNLNTLPSYVCHPLLLVPTILHSIIKPTISHCTSLILRTRLAIDPLLTPGTYSTFMFLSQTLEIFVKLPVETVLRRAQVAVLTSPQYTEDSELKTVVDVGPYNGVVGTMWSIAREEGGSTDQESVSKTGGAKTVKKVKRVQRKGQGMDGLWRGWRVGVWGLVGMYGSRAMSGAGSGESEF
ncbi:Mitochondrial carrier domain protein [Rutstroemia sp. NJR-2017a BBW]|nr:Mitochondrial carrier domain protein [Rutstroemia sp. NJR-2017a BBW]